MQRTSTVESGILMKMQKNGTAILPTLLKFKTWKMQSNINVALRAATGNTLLRCQRSTWRRCLHGLWSSVLKWTNQSRTISRMKPFVSNMFSSGHLHHQPGQYGLGTYSSSSPLNAHILHSNTLHVLIEILNWSSSRGRISRSGLKIQIYMGKNILNSIWWIGRDGRNKSIRLERRTICAVCVYSWFWRFYW